MFRHGSDFAMNLHNNVLFFRNPEVQSNVVD